MPRKAFCEDGLTRMAASVHLLGPALLHLDQTRHQLVVRVAQRSKKQEIKTRHRCEQETAHNKMMRVEPLPARQKRQQAKDAQQNNHGIEACPLPIAAAEMQPHSELVEGQGHAQSVKKSADTALGVVQFCEKQNTRDRSQQKNAVVQMMNMCSSKVEEEIRQTPRHDQNHQRARCDECKEKGYER